MRMVAILKNDDHPEYGEVSMPLPIKASEYSHCMELLSSLSIGDALNKDCKVEELTRAYPTLRCLEGCKVNIDELDYHIEILGGETLQDGDYEPTFEFVIQPATNEEVTINADMNFSFEITSSAY